MSVTVCGGRGTVGNFRIAGGHVIFVVEKWISIGQKWLYIINETIFKKMNYFFQKKIFHENHLWGTPAKFFEKIVFLKNIFCHTSSDAVSRADFEYHLSFALRCFFKGK
jgi:hypothetical protein